MIHRTPQAEDEIVEAASYIALDSATAADRFLIAVEQTLEFLHESPALGRPVDVAQPRLVAMRLWPVRGFSNYLMVYHQIEGGIELLHVVHGARDPGRLLEND